ncbi:DUF4367 domain-containing protein [Fusibacter bizertensis]
MLTDKDPAIAKKEGDLFLYKFGKIYSEQLISETEQTLAAYSDLEVPHSMDEWFESYSKTFEKKQARYNRGNKRVNEKPFKMHRVAVVFLGLILSFAVLTVISEANGYHLFDMLISDQSIYSEISFEKSDDVIDVGDYLSEIPTTWVNYYYLEKLPVGYYFLNTMEGYQSKYLVFSNDADEHLVFAQESLDISAQIDTEDAIVEEVEIGGLKGIASSKEGVTIIVWHDNSNSYILTGNIELKTLITVAESKKYIK